MPTYEYECNSCSKITSALRPIRDRRLPLRCPFCSAATAFVLSRFSISHHRKSAPVTRPVSATSHSGPTGIHVTGSGGGSFKDCHFANLKTGISAPAGAKLDIDSCTFSNVEQPIKIRDE